MSKQVFQLSALSQNDPMAVGGTKLYCKIVGLCNGTLHKESFPVNESIHLPVSPKRRGSRSTPTWFLMPVYDLNASFTIKIFCPSDSSYPVKTITVSASDVKQWAAQPISERTNQIYQEGEYGILGFAQEGPNGPIYTITAGVLNPRLDGDETTI